MASHIGRRKFLTTLGGAAAAWPLAARAQQSMPVVGFLRDATAAGSEFMVNGLRKGLAEGGFVEGHNLTIDYAWSEGQTVRLSTLAAELVGRNVSVIVTSSNNATFAAKAATSTIPVVFAINNDPVASGLVASLNRQSHRCELLDLRAWSKATGADARDGAKGYRLRRPRAPDLSDLRAVHQRC
jgi:putative tryptophan/tyrosine transport system substrate-binding protein